MSNWINWRWHNTLGKFSFEYTLMHSGLGCHDDIDDNDEGVSTLIRHNSDRIPTARNRHMNRDGVGVGKEFSTLFDINWMECSTTNGWMFPVLWCRCRCVGGNDCELTFMSDKWNGLPSDEWIHFRWENDFLEIFISNSVCRCVSNSKKMSKRELSSRAF